MQICASCKKPISDSDECYQVRFGHWVEADAQDPGEFEADEDVAYYHAECYKKED